MVSVGREEIELEIRRNNDQLEKMAVNAAQIKAENMGLYHVLEMISAKEKGQKEVKPVMEKVTAKVSKRSKYGARIRAIVRYARAAGLHDSSTYEDLKKTINPWLRERGMHPMYGARNFNRVLKHLGHRGAQLRAVK